MKFKRNAVGTIWDSLNSKQYLIDIIAGPRQVGKTTAALEIQSKWLGPVHYANADLRLSSGSDWIIFQWNQIRKKESNGSRLKLLILDEIQKINGWSETVKGLWEEDRASKNSIKALLLGSSALLLTKGFSESLAGRFFLHRFTHWTYSECKRTFKWDLDKWIYFGGYPGASQYVNEIDKWKQYITDSLIDTVIARDVLSLQSVAKPALLRNLFTLSAHYPAQIFSYNKMLGQMHDAGNTTTLAHYLRLLESAFLISGLENYSGSVIRTKSSSPKLILWNNALISALDTRNYENARNDLSWWGRLLENAVGAHLMSNLQSMSYKIAYWRENNYEIDFIVSVGRKLFAIEVKSGATVKNNPFDVFQKKYPSAQPVIIGPGGMSFEEYFLTDPKEIFS